MNLIERVVVGLCRLMLWISTAVIFVILVVNTVLRYATGSSSGTSLAHCRLLPVA